MNYKNLATEIEMWISEKIDQAKATGVLIGVSGGVDAAVCVGLAVRALGVDKVRCVVIRTTENETEYIDGIKICEAFNVTPTVLDIRDIYLEMKKILPKADVMTEGNLRDRIRSALLYYFANNENKLVVSTVNKNEYLLGYFCKNGSGMADIMPIADVYKTDIWNLARYIQVPEIVVSKAPTGDYWIGQTDEEIIGVKYSEQDEILCHIESKKIEKGGSESYEKLLSQFNKSCHKREVIPRCIISEKE